ncbi:M20/M25/M40 family metallo-hydrolase [Desulfosporosinus sp. FKB]|uniref:M28 family metallopeptidase n=1 Tax=Desulfosporosinus sp. FKB TaxID=1969835 RepID=UPI000B498110|nr:M20/M25/M40 family metallo-hydrolase [Desulfosporosinus sp. FKB]
MTTRRGFLKCLAAVGATILPWYRWTELFNRSNHQAVQASTSISCSTKQTSGSVLLADHSYINRTAMDDISVLTQANIAGRRAGTVGEEKAAAYLIEQMRGLGLEPLGDLMDNSNRNFTNSFTIYPVVEEFYNGRLTFRPGNPNELRTPSANVIGGLIGTNPNESVILSAHYDHLGVFQGNLYPGANDNASGVGCILDVMRRLIKESVKPKRNVVLAFWSAEEMGFVGSYSFVQKPTFLHNGIQSVFNVDTVGNGPLGEFALWANSDNKAVRVIQSSAEENNARALLTPNNGYNSDQVYFNLDHVPAVTLMARDWLNKNHTPEDVPDFVNPKKIHIASDILYSAVQKLVF